MDDAALIARVLDGDAKAFTAIVDRYHRDCSRFALRMLGHRQDAEDALQETFLSAYRGLARYRERQTFRAWLYRILINRCRSVARQRRRRVHRFVSDDDAIEQASSGDGDRDLALGDTLQRALDTLEPPLREAVLLKYGEGLDYRTMSEMTGARVSALKMRVKRACDQLRPRLESLDERR
jgi:RNA polymerase sigma-70 factor (ECF subfamily)